MPRPRPFARVRFARGRAVTLWCEDAIAGLPLRLPRQGVDVVVTSPPYNRKVAYSTYSDDRPRSEYLAWIGQLRDAVDTVLSPAGSFFLNVGASPSDPWLPMDVAREVGRTFVLQNVLHWVKSIAIDRSAAGRSSGLDHDLGLGHYRPVGSDRYVHGAHEYVYHFSRRGDVPLDRLAIGVPYQDKSNVARWRGAGGGLRCRGNTWFLPYPTIRYRARDRPHPATFPPELPEWCLRLHGRGRVRLAVDPFVGIGSSAVAAVRLNVPFVGFDVDPDYLAVAVERVRAERTGRRSPVTRRPAGRTRRAGSTSASASG
ncbi:MAG: site-specific DNA-methyltransferase [Thermoplasmata archaeon]|nr:site-specific DNA-methyltransferase [Thermoplasmata archaeon]